AKVDLWLAEYYDQRLVEPRLWPLGAKLREQLSQDIKSVLMISKDEQLMADLPWIAESIALRNVYTDPLNVLQAELLHRSRECDQSDPQVEQALMVTIAGIAAGMRNTG
ncbi:MAG: phosphoenolpyruvate carboxylase, partial [Morganella morganii]